MTTAVVAGVPMRELNLANDLLDDPAALQAQLDRDGYLYFRGVLPDEAVAEVRRAVFAYLRDEGVATGDDAAPTWTGKDASHLGVHPPKLHEQGLWEAFVEQPAVAAFFERILDGPGTFVPISQYRFTVPTQEESPDPIAGRHQDGFFNEGIPFRICWIPLMEIDDRIGGLALCEGMHRSALHDLDKPPRFPIPAEAVPGEVWRRTTYEPGDVLIMHPMTPHSGLPNVSDRVRLSMDLRLVPASEPAPVVGAITEIGPDRVTLRTDGGDEVSFAVTKDTYVRGNKGDKLGIGDVEIGMRRLIAHRDGAATVIRPAT